MKIVEVFWKKGKFWSKPISRTRIVKGKSQAWAEVEGGSERVEVYYDARLAHKDFLSRWVTLAELHTRSKSAEPEASPGSDGVWEGDTFSLMSLRAGAPGS